MEWLICGLGNPGPEYEKTRHNAGFEVVNIIAALFSALWEKKEMGWLATPRIKGRHVVLLKPDTYVNQSGRSVRYYLQKYNLTPSRLLVVTDDIALPVGSLRLRQFGSSGGHNGLSSIQDALNSNQWPRLRIGIDHNFLKGKQAEYVLSKPNSDELPLYEASLKRAAQAVICVLTQSLTAAMNQFNGVTPWPSNNSI